MDYLKHYNRLIARGKVRGWTKQSAPCYTEQHHVVPKCVMKDNSLENLVTLTAEEHFVAHLLLVKIYKDTEFQHRLVYAATAMIMNNEYHNRPKNKIVGWLKRKSAKAKSAKLKGRVFSKETKLKFSIAKQKENLSEETRRKMSESSKKENLSEASRAAMSASHQNRSELTRRRNSEAQKNLSILVCPHCNLQSRGRGNMKRYHFDNCRHKQ